PETAQVAGLDIHAVDQSGARRRLAFGRAPRCSGTAEAGVLPPGPPLLQLDAIEAGVDHDALDRRPFGKTATVADIPGEHVLAAVQHPAQRIAELELPVQRRAHV